MNKTQAEILLLCNEMHMDRRYSEHISSVIGKNYNFISTMIRVMRLKGWLETTKQGRKTIITNISEAALEKARGVLPNVERR